MGGIYAILNHMTGENLMTHQLPRAGRECEAELRRQHPDLAQVVVPGFASEADGRAWIAEQVARFGETRDVEPLATADHTVIDPIVEARMMNPTMAFIEVDR